MFKKFLPNQNYSFSLTEGCKYKDTVVSPDVWGLISIEIDNQIFKFELKWLSLISHYEVNLPIDELLKINFIECRSKVIGLKCGHLMTFSKPIIFENEFRVIPGFTRHVINRLGVVKSIKTGRILNESIGAYGYPYVNVYDPDKDAGDKWRSVSVHILLARAFIYNKCPEVRCFVNHKNGNKLDYSLKNLEWVTSSENNEHAVANGLREDSIPCKIMDIETKLVRSFPSLTTAFKHIGIYKRQPLCKNINGTVIPKLFSNRYEIKHSDDYSDWFYINQNVNSHLIKNIGPYQAKHLETGVVFEGKTITDLVFITNISEDRIRNILLSNIPKSCGGYHFRVKSNTEWPVDFIEVKHFKPRTFKVLNNSSSDVLYFNSVSEITRKIGIDKKTLKNRLVSNQPYKEYLIEEIESL